MSLRFIAMLMYSPLACAVSVWRPLWGLNMLVAMYYFRPEIWEAPNWFRPQLWITLAVTVGWAMNSRGVRFNAIMGLAVILLLASLMGSFFAYSTDVALDSTFILFKLIWVMFLTLQLVDTPAKLRGFIWANVIGMAWSIKTILFLGSSGGSAVRVDVGVGQAGGANYLAMILVMTLPWFWMKFNSKLKWERWYSRFAFPAYVLCTLFCGSRGGFLAMGIVVGFLVMRSNHKFAAAVAGVVLAIGVFVMLPATEKDRFIRGFSEAGLAESKTGGDFSAESRLILWREAWKMFKEKPVLGYGTDNFSLLSARRAGFFSGGHKYAPGKKGSGFVTHNTYMQTLAEGGLSQSIPFFSMLILAFVVLRRARRLPMTTRVGEECKVLSVSLEGLMIGFCVASVFGSHIKIDFLWWYMGAIASFEIMYREIQTRQNAARAAEYRRQQRQAEEEPAAKAPGALAPS